MDRTIPDNELKYPIYQWLIRCRHLNLRRHLHKNRLHHPMLGSSHHFTMKSIRQKKFSGMSVQEPIRVHLLIQDRIRLVVPNLISYVLWGMVPFLHDEWSHLAVKRDEDGRVFVYYLVLIVHAHRDCFAHFCFPFPCSLLTFHLLHNFRAHPMAFKCLL